MNKLLLVLIVLCLVVANTAFAVESYYIYDYNGVLLGQSELKINLLDASIVALKESSLIKSDGEITDLISGYYIVSPKKIEITSQPVSLIEEFGFLEAGAEYFPFSYNSPGDIAVGDINNDSLLDIVFSLSNQSVHDTIINRPQIWSQRRDNSFGDHTDHYISQPGCRSTDIELFDADNDGDLDIFMAGKGSVYYDRSCSFYININGGYFVEETPSRIPPLTYPEETYTLHTSIVDINSDGAKDIFVIIFSYDLYYAEAKMEFWLNDGNGYFTLDQANRLPETDCYGYWDFDFVDIDSDDQIDLVCTNWETIYQDDEGSILDTLNGHNAVFYNTGGGYFADETISRMPEPDNTDTRELVFVDIDNDDDLDIIEVGFHHGRYDKQVRILLNDGQGYFTVDNDCLPDSLEGWINKTLAYDFNNDGYVDIFMAAAMWEEVGYDKLLLGDSNFNFTDRSDLLPQVLDFSVAACAFDFQQDNDYDIVLANSGRTVYQPGLNTFYLNTLNDQSAIEESSTLPENTAQMNIYPNPFNNSASIEYKLEKATDVMINVYDINGRLLTESNYNDQLPGVYQFEWQAADCASGIYFIKLETDYILLNKKMVLLK